MKKALLLVLLCVFIFVAALIYQILQERKLLVRTREQAEVARLELLVTRAENGRLVGELFRLLAPPCFQSLSLSSPALFPGRKLRWQKTEIPRNNPRDTGYIFNFLNPDNQPLRKKLGYIACLPFAP